MSHNQNCVLGPKIKTRFSWTLTVFFIIIIIIIFRKLKVIDV